MQKNLILPIFALFLTFSQYGMSGEPLRPQKPSDFFIMLQQKFYRLPNARVAWVDFDLMKSDFPELRSFSNAEIENWILEQFAYISEAQLKLRNIRSSDYNVDDSQTRINSHPDNYFRSSVAEAVIHQKSAGIVDLKGTGHADVRDSNKQVDLYNKIITNGTQNDLNDLRVSDHSDGLMSLGEAIAEVSRQRAIQLGYDLKMEQGETVESYFILDTGFDILKKDGESIPSAILGRQAHIRGADKPAKLIYTDDHGKFQRSATEASVDMGGVSIQIPELRNKFRFVDASKNPQASMAWIEGHQIAREFREVAKENIFKARALIYDHLSEMLKPLESKWLQVRAQKLNHPNDLDKTKERVKYLFARDVKVRDLAFSQLKQSHYINNSEVIDELVRAFNASPTYYEHFLNFLREMKINSDKINFALIQQLPLKSESYITSVFSYFTEIGYDYDTPRNIQYLIPLLFHKFAPEREFAHEKLKHMKSIHSSESIAVIVQSIYKNPTRYIRLMQLIQETHLQSPEVNQALITLSQNKMIDKDFKAAIQDYISQVDAGAAQCIKLFQ